MATTENKPAHKFLEPMRAARRRAKALDSQLYSLRNITSVDALDIAEDLAELANEFEMIALNMRHEVKLAADARHRA